MGALFGITQGVIPNFDTYNLTKRTASLIGLSLWESLNSLDELSVVFVLRTMKLISEQGGQYYSFRLTS